MKRAKWKSITMFISVLAFAAGSLFVISSTLKAADPAGVHMTIYQTDLLSGATGTPVTIFTNTSGATVDLVGNPDVFGRGAVPPGTYKRIKFTARNLVSFAGPDPCSSGTTTVSSSVRIDSGQPDEAQVPVYFATVDDGGSSGWTANGSAAKPFLIQNSITIDANGSYIVRLIFNTSGTLICNNGTAMITPPTINALSFTDAAPATGGYCSTMGDYWFFHYTINSYPSGSTGSLIPDPSLTQIMQSSMAISTWGSLSLSAPNATTGAGTWTINGGNTYAAGGMAEHRHNLYQYDTSYGDQGYFDPSGSATFSGPFMLKGSTLLLDFGKMTINGAMSADCSTFVGAVLDNQKESALFVAVKKAASQPAFALNSAYVIAEPEAMLHYTSGPTGTITDSFAYDIHFTAIRSNSTGTSDAAMMEWKNRFDVSPSWTGTGSFTINPMTEEVHMDAGFDVSAMFTVRSDGLITEEGGAAPEEFSAIDVNGNGIMAGDLGDTNAKDPGWHRLVAGLVVRTNPAPALGDLSGTWYFGALESRLNSSTTNTWGMGISYGRIVFSADGSGNVRADGNITFRDNFAGELHNGSFSSAAVTLHTECYAWNSATNAGLAVSTAPGSCIIPGTSTPGVTMPVFYLTDSTGSTAKFALDYNKTVMVIWSPIDTDGIPCDSSLGGCTGDPASKAMGGIGVKVQ